MLLYNSILLPIGFEICQISEKKIIWFYTIVYMIII